MGALVDNNPDKTFDNFSYNIEDEDLNELVTLNDSITNQLMTNSEIPSKTDLAVKKIYQDFSEKYGLKIGFDDFNDCLNNLANTSKTEAQMLEAINAKVSTLIAQQTKAKMMISLKKLIDRSFTTILKQTEGMTELDPAAVGMIDKGFQWYKSIGEIEEKYNETVSDPDRTLDKLSKIMHKNLDNDNSGSESDEDKAKQNELINSILASINITRN